MRPALAIKRAKRKKIVDKFKSRLIARATKAEIAFEHILVDLRIPYIFQHDTKIRYGKKKTFAIVDFYLPDVRCVVEIDGGYHEDVVQQYLDAARTAALTRGGRIEAVIRFTNEGVLRRPNDVAVSLVKQIEETRMGKYLSKATKGQIALIKRSNGAEERKVIPMTGSYAGPAKVGDNPHD